MIVLSTTDSHLTRKVPASYSDGVYMMGGENRPNPRKLSELFMKGPDGLGSVMNRTALFAFFGMYYSLYSLYSLYYISSSRPVDHFLYYGLVVFLPKRKSIVLCPWRHPRYPGTCRHSIHLLALAAGHRPQVQEKILRPCRCRCRLHEW